MIGETLDCVGTTDPVGKHDFRERSLLPALHTSANAGLLRWAERNPKAVAAILAGEAVVLPAKIGRDRLVEASYHKSHGGGFFVNIDDTRLDGPGEGA